MDESVERAERFLERRGKICMLMALVCACVTVISVTSMGRGIADLWQILNWLLWLLIPLIYSFAQPWGWNNSEKWWSMRRWGRFSRGERAIINDELAQFHRGKAIKAGFLVLFGGLTAGSLSSFGTITLPVWWPMALASAAVAISTASFGWLQLQAQGDME